MQNDLTSVSKNASPHIVFLGTTFSSDQIKKTYSLLNHLQNLAPYQARISLVVEKLKETFSVKLELASTPFSTCLILNDNDYTDLLGSLKDEAKEQLSDWKKSRF